MKKASDIMTTDVVTVSADTEVGGAARLLLEKGFNGVPVTDAGGRLLGILCQSDLVAQQKKFPVPSLFTTLDGFIPLRSSKRLEEELHKIAATTVGEAMTREVITVSSDTPVDEIASLMVDKKIHTLPVVDGDHLVGVIGKEDILRIVTG